MANGYEKSEDYGGKPPSRFGLIIIIMFWVVVAGLIVRFI